MNNDFKALSKYRLERAKEDLENSEANYIDNFLKGLLGDNLLIYNR